jgi:SAM-dependent methyltransferase
VTLSRTLGRAKLRSIAKNHASVGAVAGFRRALRDRSRVVEWRFGWRWRAVESRTDVLNYLATTKGYRRYLEIGVRDPRTNYDRVRVRDKISVDPAPEGPVAFRLSSDEFFAQLSLRDHLKPFDLILVDGLHFAEQVERDIENSLRFLAPGGAIVVHDCNPPTEAAQSLDYDGIKVWTGTVWKAWVKFRATRRELAMLVIDVDYGCGVITRGQQECYPMNFTSYDELEYQILLADRRRMLNLMSPKDFMDRSRQQEEVGQARAP